MQTIIDLPNEFKDQFIIIILQTQFLIYNVAVIFVFGFQEKNV